MSSTDSDSDRFESFLDDLNNPHDAVDCLGLREGPKLTAYESRMRKKFTFDRNKYREFPDLRIYSI